MSCAPNADHWKTVHNLCLESKPADANMASWNKSCCAKIECSDPGSVMVACGSDMGKKPTMNMEYQDNNLVYNKRFVSGGVGIL
jgi:hypothetical protein